MDKVLVDTNIVIDLLAKRTPFYKDAQELFTLADYNKNKLFVSALTFADTHYLLSNQYKIDTARKILLKFKTLVSVLPFNDKVLDLALVSDFKDFEDTVQFHIAQEHNLDIIVTRNKKDFALSSLPVLTAKEYLHKLQ
ncbi:twitching motility protein PilT [Arachidicoccus ginsenosidimutans]|uniref:type II toxin-antitoxin system VapC family toxin n=1 Tax=Arachidicoccus sp. BS20 TaxID=1850526 RepID=UPI0007F136CA|nr:PIN domain-containing protein [Arachidicoccus sp. BS20]ANI90047.1 twitching motility protein PilT [Arachidicoccus sp. BS20]